MDDSQFRKRLTELAQKAGDRGCCTFTDFLGQAELDIFHRLSASLTSVASTLYSGGPGLPAAHDPVLRGAKMRRSSISCSPLNKKFADAAAIRPGCPGRADGPGF